MGGWGVIAAAAAGSSPNAARTWVLRMTTMAKIG
jgi:hypothetical protein